MARIHLAGTALVALTCLSMLSATATGPLAAAIILAVAALKATAVLRYFLGLDRACGGWGIVLPGFVVALCLVVGALRAAASTLPLP